MVRCIDLCTLANTKHISDFKSGNSYIITPKIDGVRAYHSGEAFIARSKKSFANKFINQFLNSDVFSGFDGEFYAGGSSIASDLCRKTSSFVNSEDTQGLCAWMIFDYLTPQLRLKTYSERLAALLAYIQTPEVKEALSRLREVGIDIYTVHSQTFQVNSPQALEDKYLHFLAEGYEGAIVRNPKALYSNGRAGKNYDFFRLKPYVTTEIEITALVEAETNLNSPELDPRGYASRSSHKANKLGAGKIGALYGRLLEDVHTGNLLIPKHTEVKVSAGCMDHGDRTYFWEHPEEIKGTIATIQFLDHGAKSKLRSATFKHFRPELDL